MLRESGEIGGKNPVYARPKGKFMLEKLDKARVSHVALHAEDIDQFAIIALGPEMGLMM